MNQPDNLDSTPSPDANNCLLVNRYQLQGLISKGSLGRVYQAEDMLLGGIVAIQFLAQTLSYSKIRERFRIVARICSQLGRTSPYLPKVLDYGLDDDDMPFYVLEYLHGDSLRDIISLQTLSLPRFFHLAHQICLGIECAHQGVVVDGQIYSIIHSDIKPSKILVMSDASGIGERVKILDFGITEVRLGGQTQGFAGSLTYAAPEQMDGQALDARSNIYSLGVMLFEMLTSKLPFQAESQLFRGYRAHISEPPRSFQAVAPNRQIPPALQDLVMSCLAKSPADRPQSMAEVLKVIETLMPHD